MDFTTIFVYLRGLIGTILTFLMMLAPLPSSGPAYSAENPDELITSFAVVSDCHVETNNPDSYKAFKGLIEGVKGGEDISTAVFLGDNVMNGQELENIFFYGALKAVKPAENMLVVMGNHDIGNGEGKYTELRDTFLGYNHILTGERYEKPYYYKVIDGCYFIALGLEDLTVNTSVMTEEQLIWLEGVLEEAKAADAPAFVLNHHPMTSLTNVAWDSLINLLDNYDNVIYFHGHTHSKLDDDSCYSERNIPVVELPRSTEVVDYEPGDGVVVEVYEGRIVVRGRNFIEGEWLENVGAIYE